MDLNLSPGAVFHAEFVSGSKIGPEPTQNPILTIFREIVVFPFFIGRRHRPEALFNILSPGLPGFPGMAEEESRNHEKSLGTQNH